MLSKTLIKERFKQFLDWSTLENRTLGRKAVQGAAWLTVLKFFDRLFIVIRTIILARLLAPRDFGVFGVALLTIAFLEVFTNTGFHYALVQKKGDIRPYLNTAWSVQVIRGTLLSFLMFIASPVISRFFDEPSAIWPLRVIGLSSVLISLANPAVVYFQKELEFRKQFIYQLSGTIMDIAVSISLAFVFQNEWALIFGNIARNFVYMLISYRLHNYRPRFSIEYEKFRGLYSFGVWILFAHIVVYITHSGDSIVVGKVLGITFIGLYQMAYLIANAPFSEISGVACAVSFPIYSKLQNDRKALRDSFLRIVRMTALLSLPLASLIFILSEEIVVFFLGNKWVAIVPALRVLALWNAGRSILAMIAPVYQALGKPKYDLYLQLIRLLIIAGTIYPFMFWWGITGAAMSIMVSSIIADPFGYFWLMRMTDCKLKEILHSIFPSLLSSLAMICSLWLIKMLIVLPSIGGLLFYSSAAGIIFLCALLLLDRIMGKAIKSDVRYIVRNLRTDTYKNKLTQEEVLHFG